MAQTSAHHEAFAGQRTRPEPLLLERGAARAALLDAIEAVRHGVSCAVFVEGAAGLGKTALLAWARAAAERTGFAVASAVASATEAHLPFGLFGQALVALGSSAIDDVERLARLGGRPARLLRVFRFLVGVAERGRC